MANDLNIPTIADGQADQQWQTSNDGDAAIADAFGDLYTVDFTAGNVTLTAAQFRSANIFIGSNLSATRVLTLPAVKRPFWVYNPDAADSITVTKGATTVSVGPLKLALCYTDGTTDGLIGVVVTPGLGGSGDVVGPASATNNNIAVFDGTTGKLIKDGGATIASLGISDGDKGDITVSSSGTVWRVDALASPSAGVILYADNNSPGSWQQLAAGTSGQFLKTNGAAAPSWSNVPYDLPLSFAGTPTAGQLMGKIIAVRDVVLGANFTGSVGHVGTNPGATFDIDVKDDGSTIGTISVSTSGVFTFTTTSGTAKTITSGHRLEFYAPANSPAEATVANIAATLKGTAI